MSCGDDCGLVRVPVKPDFVGAAAPYEPQDRREVCPVGGGNPYPAAQFHAVRQLNFPGIGPIGSQYKYDVNLTAQAKLSGISKQSKYLEQQTVSDEDNRGDLLDSLKRPI